MKLPRNPISERDRVWAVIETPAGSRVKYKWNADRELFEASRLLPMGMAFPYDFGFFPGTKAQDGDPLDVMVLSEVPLAVGALVCCSVIGGIGVRQSQEPGGKLVANDRLLCVPAISPRAAEWTTLDALGGAVVCGIAEFLRTYVELQGRSFELVGPFGRDRALELVRSAA